MFYNSISPVCCGIPTSGPCRFFYASSACIYPEGKQLNTEVEGGGLKEADAWPAQPQDAYGLEKLASEEIAKHYDSDFGMECRIARFHNIYGPYGTWKGGREKAPAAFCRKAICAEVWTACCVLCPPVNLCSARVGRRRSGLRFEGARACAVECCASKCAGEEGRLILPCGGCLSNFRVFRTFV